MLAHAHTGKLVALLAEGVDRNQSNEAATIPEGGSPSSRRAWIEIGHLCGRCCCRMVALLAEGVDRNQIIGAALVITLGRPPRGGRG